MPDTIICTFDSTFDGFLSVIFRVVRERFRPVQVCGKEYAQLMLDAEVMHVETDSASADVVRRAITNAIGYDGFKRVYLAFLNSDPNAPTAAYKYLMYAFKYKKQTSNYLSNPDIFAVYKLADAVSRELDRMKGFLRFSVMEGGVEYAVFEPDHDILSPITIHFADRLRSIPFIIHDKKREKASVYDTHEWFITDAKGITPPALSPDEKNFRTLWREFYRALTINERKNERLQTQMLPKKYRRHITEFM
ncbi:MAG: TIGR03915 family putative DNA repair protein [Clostridia bacterium]|nr:TIGR03915 family putative DNA repair protein [Clostridia bacterium]